MTGHPPRHSSSWPCLKTVEAAMRPSLTLEMESGLSAHGATRLFPYLCIGSGVLCTNEAAMKAEGIGYIINCTTHCPNLFPGQFRYLRLPVADAMDADIGTYFAEARAFIQRARRRGATCFVHCSAGMSRSATVVLSFLMAAQGMALVDALAFLRARRPQTAPNAGFMAQLLALEHALFARVTVDLARYEADRFAAADALRLPHTPCAAAAAAAAAAALGLCDADASTPASPPSSPSPRGRSSATAACPSPRGRHTGGGGGRVSPSRARSPPPPPPPAAPRRGARTLVLASADDCSSGGDGSGSTSGASGSSGSAARRGRHHSSSTAAARAAAGGSLPPPPLRRIGSSGGLLASFGSGGGGFSLQRLRARLRSSRSLSRHGSLESETSASSADAPPLSPAPPQQQQQQRQRLPPQQRHPRKHLWPAAIAAAGDGGSSGSDVDIGICAAPPAVSAGAPPLHRCWLE